MGRGTTRLVQDEAGAALEVLHLRGVEEAVGSPPAGSNATRRDCPTLARLLLLLFLAASPSIALAALPGLESALPLAHRGALYLSTGRWERLVVRKVTRGWSGKRYPPVVGNVSSCIHPHNLFLFILIIVCIIMTTMLTNVNGPKFQFDPI